MYKSSKVFWEKWFECMKSVWTVFVRWTALVYESCKILREKWSLVKWIPFVQLFQGRFLLWSESSLDILWKERKALTIVTWNFWIYLYVSPCHFPINHVSRYICLFFLQYWFIFSLHHLKCSVAIGFGVSCMVLSNGKGRCSDKILAVQAWKPIYTLNIEHENIWTRYAQSITFIFKNKNYFIVHIISLLKCIPLVFWKYLFRILAW